MVGGEEIRGRERWREGEEKGTYVATRESVKLILVMEEQIVANKVK